VNDAHSQISTDVATQSLNSARMITKAIRILKTKMRGLSGVVVKIFRLGFSVDLRLPASSYSSVDATSMDELSPKSRIISSFRY